MQMRSASDLQILDLVNFCKRKNIKCIILRLSSILSKNCSVNFYCKALKKIKNNLSIKIIGREKKINSIFFVDDLTKLTQLLIKKRQINKVNIYNVASKKPVKLINVIKLIHKSFNKPFKIKILEKKDKNYIVSIKKLKYLKFKIPTTLQTINKFIIANKKK